MADNGFGNNKSPGATDTRIGPERSGKTAAPSAIVLEVAHGPHQPRTTSMNSGIQTLEASTVMSSNCTTNIPSTSLDTYTAIITMASNGSLNITYPSSSDTGQSITQKGFKITTRKLPILKAAPIEEMTSKLGITTPEMIFGDNLVTIEHPLSGWAINFNAFDALNMVDKTGESMLKVAYSKEWQKNRYEGWSWSSA